MSPASKKIALQESSGLLSCRLIANPLRGRSCRSLIDQLIHPLPCLEFIEQTQYCAQSLLVGSPMDRLKVFQDSFAFLLFNICCFWVSLQLFKYQRCREGSIWGPVLVVSFLLWSLSDSIDYNPVLGTLQVWGYGYSPFLVVVIVQLS